MLYLEMYIQRDLYAKYIKNLFKGSVYTDTDENEIDVLIVDEAHILNAKSGMFKNIGENQIKQKK